MVGRHCATNCQTLEKWSDRAAAKCILQWAGLLRFGSARVRFGGGTV